VVTVVIVVPVRVIVVVAVVIVAAVRVIVTVVRVTVISLRAIVVVVRVVAVRVVAVAVIVAHRRPFGRGSLQPDGYGAGRSAATSASAARARSIRSGWEANPWIWSSYSTWRTGTPSASSAAA